MNFKSLNKHYDTRVDCVKNLGFSSNLAPVKSLCKESFDLLFDIKTYIFSDVESDTEAEIETVFIHPSYGKSEGGGAVNDIALIKLKKPVKLDQFIQPACLPYRFARNCLHFKQY